MMIKNIDRMMNQISNNNKGIKIERKNDKLYEVHII